jgi:hypothetical protein
MVPDTTVPLPASLLSLLTWFRPVFRVGVSG